MSKGGRPTKYRSEMCGRLVEAMREGMSITEAAVEIGVGRATLYRWAEEHEAFRDAVKTGEALSQAWWEREARTSLRDKEFSAVLWYMNMKNRFGWRDRQELNAEAGKPLVVGVRIAEDDRIGIDELPEAGGG